MEKLLIVFIIVLIALPLAHVAINWWSLRKLKLFNEKHKEEHKQRLKDLQEMCVAGLLNKAEIHFCVGCKKQIENFLNQSK